MKTLIIFMLCIAPVLPAQSFSAKPDPRPFDSAAVLRSAARLSAIADSSGSQAQQAQTLPLLSHQELATQLLAQPYDTTAEGVHSGRMWLVGGTMFAVNAGIMGYYFATFYNDEYADRAPFHSFNDWYNADLNVDKLGHIWGSQTYARTLFHMFRWTGMEETQNMYWSSALALFYQLEMEIIDGLYAKWGFSWWDMAANTVGSTWPNLQRIYPALQSVNIKMSYHPSPAVKAGWIEHDYLRDYDGFTYWLSLSVEDVLPEAAQPYWPDWLNIAVGYGANNTMLGDGIFNSAGGVGQGEQEWYLALDYDFRRLPGDSAFMDFVRESLNLFHFPAPAIRITPSGIFYGLYF
ncbi:YfiM family protein [bacterium]|nr:YfiM family protein [bacterium]